VNRTYCYAPATDTQELPSPLRGCPPTTELHMLGLQPPVRTRYERPPLRSSGPIRHLWASARSAFWPLACGAGVILGVLAAGR
jgi:hypothetical protein